MSKKITIVGAGYVGMSLSYVLAKNNDLKIYDLDKSKIRKINSGTLPKDKKVKEYLRTNGILLNATHSKKEAYKDAEYIVVCTPTDYNENQNFFDTSSVENVLDDAIKDNNQAVMVIKSTVPIGFTSEINKKYSGRKILFSPEFLREDRLLEDNLFPSRIIVGEKNKHAEEFATLLQEGSKKKNIDTFFMTSSEAEAVKLFSNTYLAMRVSFFNELDTFSMSNNLNTKKIIQGVSSDERIGNFYNNPSFGYGGYCLPKDTKQLLANYKRIPQKLIGAVVSSNSLRKDFIVKEILKKNPSSVGIYLLSMKLGSNNYRSSAVQGIVKRLKENGIKILIYEPLIKKTMFQGSKIIKNLSSFKAKSDFILANRMSAEIEDVKDKVLTRDIFEKDS